MLLIFPGFKVHFKHSIFQEAFLLEYTARFLTLHNTFHNPYHMGSAVPVSYSHWIAGSGALDFSWFLASSPLSFLGLSKGAVSY